MRRLRWLLGLGLILGLVGTAVAHTPHALPLTDQGSDQVGGDVENASFSPEPATIALLALGSIAMLLRRQGRKSTAAKKHLCASWHIDEGEGWR